MELTKEKSLALKGIAILMMYVHHFYLSSSRYAGYEVDFFPLTESQTIYLAQFFKICVALFVFLTGYGMTAGVKQRHGTLFVETEELLIYSAKRLFSLLSNFFFVYLLVIITTLPSGRFFSIYGRNGSSLLYAVIDALGLSQALGTPKFLETWWYMSLAFVLICLFPLLIKLYREFRWTFIVGVILVPHMLDLTATSRNLPRWILAMVLGIYCADTHFFSRVKRLETRHPSNAPQIVSFFLYTAVLIGLVITRQSDAGSELLDVIDGIVPVYIAIFCLRWVFPVQPVQKALSFLGKYSMNMFLIHNFFRLSYFFTIGYIWGNAWLNVLVCILITLPLSVFIEWLKRVSSFVRLQETIRHKIDTCRLRKELL